GHWYGWLGLAITCVSIYGLSRCVQAARATRGEFASALAGSLGPEWAADLDPRWKRQDERLEWRRVATPFRFKRRGVERIRNIQYVDGDHIRRHRLDIYRSPDAGPGAPVLLQIHGGAWVIGNKEQQGLQLMNLLATRGWVCVAINYRLSPHYTWPDHIVDCKLAMKWIRAHIAEYGGDPDYVVATGGSAGGHLTALLGLTANDPQFQPGFEAVDTSVRAMVPFYGVFDWTNRFGQRGKKDGLRSTVLERLVVKKKFEDAREVFDQASPMSHVRPDAPPTLVVHGDSDTLAPVAEAREFVRMLRDVSHNPVVYVELKGAHHAFEIIQSIRSLETIAAVDEFLSWLLHHDAPRAVAELASPPASPGPTASAASDRTTTAHTAP
ncbi:MAG TPA: alpha/beta hydrolase, partial [Acidimicrobiia bacterium]|nr:alpha/beta hydrolase [Acidimicrobiia bacterium]